MPKIQLRDVNLRITPSVPNTIRLGLPPYQATVDPAKPNFLRFQGTRPNVFTNAFERIAPNA